MLRHFPAHLTPDEDGHGYVAECPLIEGCISQGDTRTEALANLRDAIALCLEDPLVRARLEAFEDLDLQRAG